MTVLVCGGRGYTDWDTFCRSMDFIHAQTPITAVVHGNARGADSFGKAWAITHGIPHHPYPADWRTHGKAAGAIRNQQMLDSEAIDVVVSFPGGNGTADMVRRATRAGIPINVVTETGVIGLID